MMLKFMKPEILVKLNEDNENTPDAVARAMEVEDQWEENGKQYAARLREITPRLPDGVVTFLNKACLHDAAMLGELTGVGGRSLVLLAKLVLPRIDSDNECWYYGLYYQEIRELRTVMHEGSYFTELDPHPEWAYDEFDITEDGYIVHSILFSDGRELEITFRHFTWTQTLRQE